MEHADMPLELRLAAVIHLLSSSALRGHLRGATSNKLVELLERRLDNMAFRAGFAPTIPTGQRNTNRPPDPSSRWRRRAFPA